jgi:hypothetical protein
MKTAVCVSGQPRFVDEFLPQLLNNIIKPNDADVFLHMWYSDDMTTKPFRPGEGWKKERISINSDKKVLETLKPKAYIIEPQISFQIPDIDFTKTSCDLWNGKHERKEITDGYVFSAISQWYSIYQAQKLRQEYAVKNNILYDYVVRVRLDMGFHHPIIAKEFDPQKLHFNNCSHDSRLCHDWINLGGREVMDVYSNIYSLISYCYKNTGIWCNEYWIKFIMDLFKIETQGNNWSVYIHSRNL